MTPNSSQTDNGITFYRKLKIPCTRKNVSSFLCWFSTISADKTGRPSDTLILLLSLSCAERSVILQKRKLIYAKSLLDIQALNYLVFHMLRLRSCLFCEGRISVLKRWFKTPIQNAVHGSTVYASLEKKTISWACTAHCSRLLFELKWTGKAFIWRHLNVVICDFAFMLPPESAFCSNHDRKRTFLGCVHAYFARAESAFWNADSKCRSKTPLTGVLFMLPSRRRRFREHALRIVRAQVNRKGVYMTSFKRGYMWFCVHASTRISVLL